MPDITATRPAAGAPIDTPWGQSVHDILEGIQTGAASCVFSNSTASSIVAVTFARAYATAPIVVGSLGGGGGNAWGLAFGITTTGFSAQVRSPATVVSGTFICNWIAIGTPA